MEYLLIFVILLAGELLYFRVADHFNIIDKPNERSSHTRITLRGGGIIFYVGVLLYFFMHGFGYPWFMLGLTLIALISFVDDVHSVSQKPRLAVHFIAMLLMFYQWGLFTQFPLWYILIALVCCTGIINAYNFMDGINGITGGYSLVVLAALAYINCRCVQFIEPDFLYVAMSAVAVFCFFNFRKRAKCFAGDVGSVSIAFIILFVLGKLILETDDLTYIILLAVYGVDSVLTIIHRLLLHENISLPHRKHLYQIMANELRVPHVVVSLVYMIVQIAVIAGFLWLGGWHIYYLFGILLVLSGCYVIFMRRYFHLHLESKRYG